ncbi:hypothetical protein [Clostridium botulinum]|uniref:hypothetical protein n=1 Tax=Clostridium botulinum TaxID=1491 RepID=UPI00217D7160|nr:hypothetical protein [Clostridium botulinum]
MQGIRAVLKKKGKEEQLIYCLSISMWSRKGMDNLNKKIKYRCDFVVGTAFN